MESGPAEVEGVVQYAQTLGDHLATPTTQKQKNKNQQSPIFPSVTGQDSQKTKTKQKNLR